MLANQIAWFSHHNQNSIENLFGQEKIDMNFSRLKGISPTKGVRVRGDAEKFERLLFEKGKWRGNGTIVVALGSSYS